MQWPKDNDLQNTNVALIITTKLSSKCSIFSSFSFQVLYAKHVCLPLLLIEHQLLSGINSLKEN